MPWMTNAKDKRKDMYFHPIDYKDAMKDGWMVIDPPRGENLSEYMPITPAQARAEAPAMPEGASIAGGDPVATDDPSPADDGPADDSPVVPDTVDLKADTKAPIVKTDKKPRNTETSRADFAGTKSK